MEAWRCSGCKRLMYNKDPRGYPCSGAPLPLYLNDEHKQVCSLCYDLVRALETADKNYWKNLPEIKNPVILPDPIHKHC